MTAACAVCPSSFSTAKGELSRREQQVFRITTGASELDSIMGGGMVRWRYASGIRAPAAGAVVRPQARGPSLAVWTQLAILTFALSAVSIFLFLDAGVAVDNRAPWRVAYRKDADLVRIRPSYSRSSADPVLII